MNILLVSSYLPYPLFSGGHIRLYNLIKELSKKHAITLICEKRDYQTEQDVKEGSKFCQKVITLPRKKQWSIENILKIGFWVYPFLMVGHTLPQMKKAIEGELKRNHYNLVHVETFYVMRNLPKTHLPVVLVEQNIEYLVYKRFADQVNPILKPLLYLDALKLKFWEERFWQKASWVVVTSREEQEQIGRITKTNKVAIVSNGVDLKNFTRRFGGSNFKLKKREKRILFIGDFRWLENRDAVEWLLTAIWPLIKSKIDIKLWIVGKEIPDSIRRLTDDPDVIFDEHAPDDTREIYEKANLLLAPIRVGGGTKFKILESMASGVPVVTTRIGIEGIEAHENEEVLLAEAPGDLAQKVIEVLQNPPLYKRLAENARKVIEEKYNWSNIVRRLEKVYASAIEL